MVRSSYLSIAFALGFIPASIPAATPFESALELDEQPGISASDPIPAWHIDPDDTVTSPDITHNQSAAFTIHATGPDTLTFSWAVSSEPDYDQLRFRIGDTVAASISGEVPWTHATISIPAGDHTLTWEYIKDEDVSEGLDHGSIDNIRFASASVPQATYPAFVGAYVGQPLTVTPVHRSPDTTFTSPELPPSLTLSQQTGTIAGTATSPGQFNLTITAANTVGTTSLPVTVQAAPALAESAHTGWTWDGDAPWQSESTAFRSGPINDDQHTDLNLPVTGPALATFHWRVDSEGGFDTLSLLIDDTTASDTSGTNLEISDLTEWQQHTVAVPGGPHILTWRYQKDGAEFEGEDAAWIDQLVIHDSSDPDLDGTPSLLEIYLGTDPDTPDPSPIPTPTNIDNRFRWQIPTPAATTGITPIIEFSTDLRTWSTTPLQVTHSNSSITAQEISPTTHNAKFVRLRLTTP